MALTFFFLSKFNHKIDDNILNLTKSELNRFTKSLITDKIDHNILNNTNLNNILIINKNNQDEILYVSFNLDQAYHILDDLSNILTTTFQNLEDSNIDIAYYDPTLSHKAHNLILNIPLGSILNSTYFYNYGPKIPVKVNYIGSILTNLETNITNYGFNNALVELYVYIELSCHIIGHKEETINLNYKALISSMMVEGEVPQIYGGSIATQSNIIEKKIT